VTEDQLQMLRKARQILADQRFAIAREIVSTGTSGPAQWDHLHKIDLALQSLDIAINDEGQGQEAPADPIYGVGTA
jgi:hypothetical protein